MDKFKVEKNVELPKKHPHRSYKYPFRDMEVGDSFFVKNGNATNISSSAYHYRIRGGEQSLEKFTTRTVPGGVRCWRTE